MYSLAWKLISASKNYYVKLCRGPNKHPCFISENYSIFIYYYILPLSQILSTFPIFPYLVFH